MPDTTRKADMIRLDPDVREQVLAVGVEYGHTSFNAAAGYLIRKGLEAERAKLRKRR